MKTLRLVAVSHGLVASLAGLSCLLAAGSAFAAEGNSPEGEARQVAKEFAQKLSTALKQELASGGPASAITVCLDLAPGIAADLSRTRGWKVARVSLKPRNALLGPADAWEQSALLEFDRRASAGDKGDTLEFSEIVTEPQGRFLRYIKAIPVQPLCLACHGQKENLDDSVRAKLSEAYPHDRATGYDVGMVRGAITIKQPLQ
jgi:hypothetical protein